MKNISGKYFFLTLLSLAIYFFISSFGAKFSSDKDYNFKIEKASLEEKAGIELNKIIEHYETQLNETSNLIDEEIAKSPTSLADFLEIANGFHPGKILVNIFFHRDLVGWNKKQIATNDKITSLIKKHKNNGYFFLNTPLFVYLAKINSYRGIKVLLAIPIEKKYSLGVSGEENVSLKNKIENLVKQKVAINYSPNNSDSNKIIIENDLGKKIGSMQIALDNLHIEKSDSIVWEVLKSISLLSAFFFLFLFLKKIVSPLPNWVLNVLLIVTIIVGRYLLLITDFTGLLGASNLTNPIYFSSTFGNGITKSPLELFITVLASLFIVFHLNKILTTVSESKRFLLPILFIASLVFILLYNGFASTIRSVIFDSSILYFKDATLFRDGETTFMYLNILLVGIIAILFAANILLAFTIVLRRKWNSKYYFPWVLLILSVIIIVDEIVFAKSSITMALLYLLIVAGVSYYKLFQNKSTFINLLILLLSGSILSISFLNFFNSELEKRSLKTIANELTRTNTELYEFYVENAARSTKKNDEIVNEFLSGEDLDELAFLIWNKANLVNTVQNSAINIFDLSGNLIGNFNYNIPTQKGLDWNLDTSDSIKIMTFFNDRNNSEVRTVKGLFPIMAKGKPIYYVEIIANYNGISLDFSNNKEFFSRKNLSKYISVNPKMLKIFIFQNGILQKYFTNVFLTDEEKLELKNSVEKNQNEVWLNLKIDNDNNLFYVKTKSDNGKSTTIAVGLRDQDLTWSLYDFFRVFFIHVIMIIIVLIFFGMMNYREWHNLKISFKTKILISLLLVSIIPLILLAIYFKSISDEKNMDTINYKLGKRADSIEEYTNRYFSNSDLDEYDIFEKATEDLGINYSLYENTELIFSSNGDLYRAGIFPKIINPKAYIAINENGIKESILKETIEGRTFNSLYHKANINGKSYIINISDAFNSFQLPMTGIELNVILFGTYSLAIILITILSTMLANQISSPIERLTKATRSVSHGDMDIQVENYESGEIQELIDGFNQMIRKLKRNQIELAEVERESAWREMAKQVAHEIKNPLTPMKLAVQHLVIAHKDKSDKFDFIFEKVTKTIINQIDILKNIASEFSSFAKMPNVKLNKIDLIDIVNATADLFIKEKCKIEITSSVDELIFIGDKEETQRMFVNLIRNSIQANASEIMVSVSINNDKVIIEVKDNGTGITSENLGNIFNENFTTKDEGMGLGLSITKRYLKMIGGVISIKETSNNGTTFLIVIKRK